MVIRDHINGSSFRERHNSQPRRLRGNQGDYIHCYQQQECSRIVDCTDHGCSRSFDSRSVLLEDGIDYPRISHSNQSMTLIRTMNARPSARPIRDYMEEDVHLDQPLPKSVFLQRREYPNDQSYVSYYPHEEVILDQQPSLRSNIPERSRYDTPSSYDRLAEVVVPHQPIARPRYPERRRRYSDNHSYGPPYSRSNFYGKRRFSENSPSHRNYHRRDSTKYEGRYVEARHPRSFKRKHHAFRAERWEGTKERDSRGVDRSSNMRSRFTTSKRSFYKSSTHYVKYDNRPEKQVRRASNSTWKSPSDFSKGTAPASVSHSAKVLETNSLEDNEEVDSTNKLAEKLSEDNAEGNLTKKVKTMSSNDNTGTNRTKMPATKSSIDNAEGNLTKKLETKSTEDKAGTNLTKKLATKLPKDDAEANVTKKLVTKSSKDDAEATVTKSSKGDIEATAANPHKDDVGATATKSSKAVAKADVAKANDSKKLATKLSKDDAEANVTKKVATKSSRDDAEANVTEKLVTSYSQDDAEGNLAKKLAKKSPIDDAEANLTKKLAINSSLCYAEPKLTKNLGTKLSEDNAEANVTKEPGAKVNAEGNLTKKLETNSSKSDQKEVEHEKQNNGSEIMKLKTKFSSNNDAASHRIKLMKDGKFICYAGCTDPPFPLSSSWNVDIVKMNTVKGLLDLPKFYIFPSFKPSHGKNESDQKTEWNKFLNFLHRYDKVAIVKHQNVKIHVFPAEREPNVTDDGLYFIRAAVAYDLQETCDTSMDLMHGTSDEVKKKSLSPHLSMKHVAFESDAYVKGSSSAEKGACSSISKCHEHNSLQHYSAKEGVASERNFARTYPSYLKILGQAHSGWIFGAIAELVDNSRDARASRLDIAVETIYNKTLGSEIPMLSVIDDGVGMNHQEILRMISIGHKEPDADNRDLIGRFGVGFKTGSMRLGRDALVLTQTTNSRSVAFLSQTLNEGKENVEIPIVSYCRQAQCMDIDTSVHSEALAKYNLDAIKQFSPFNEYLIGEKAALFGGNTGTQIYIWNLDKWGSEYTLEWQAGLRGGSSFHQGDIFIRSRRVRKRPGQTSRKVYIDYSLRSYLEVIFLEPRMKIYVQDSLVRSRPLAKSLNKTAMINGEIMGKQVQLTLGRGQIEWEEANCGIFLYWHGRLIEAYKRVGGMVHSADMGRGVIGVIDVTELMDDGNGGVLVHNKKQGFEDSEPYALLEEWLGKKADEYWDMHFDPVQLKKDRARYKPDNEWVQCDKCRKWRLLNSDFDRTNLPKDWLCYMEPFNGRCEVPEQKSTHEEITVGLKRTGHDPDGLQTDSATPIPQGTGQNESTPPTEDHKEFPVLKRIRRGLRNAKK